MLRLTAAEAAAVNRSQIATGSSKHRDPRALPFQVALSMIRTGLIELAFDCNDHLTQLGTLAQRYGDRKPNLADLCLVRMSELHPRLSVITTDRRDFRVYRRNKRDTIPLICPPGV